MRVCDYAAKHFCAAPYFLGAAPSKSAVKQHNATSRYHSANVGQESAGTFRSSAEASRSVTASAVYLRSGLASPTKILDKGKPQTGVWTRNALIPCVCLSVCRERVFKAPIGYPKKQLEYVCLRSYDISYVLRIVSYVLSYALCHLKFI